MPIRVPCPECESVLKLADTLRGKKIRCKDCGATFRVPSGKDEGIQAKAKPKVKRSASVDEERPTPRKRIQKQQSNSMLLIGLAGGALVVLLLCLTGGGVSAYLLMRKPAVKTDVVKNAEKPKEEEPVFNDPVTIKLKSRGEGDVGMVTQTRNDSGTTKAVDGQGKVLLNQIIKGSEVREYKETIVKIDKNKRAAKLEREYTRAEDHKNGLCLNWDVVGKTVVIEKRGAIFDFQLKGAGKLPAPFLIHLSKEFNGKNPDRSSEMERMLLPKAAVKPGETWKLDMDALVNVFGDDASGQITSANPTGEGRLVKVYAKDGKKYGVLDFKMTIPLKAMGRGPREMKFEDGAKISVDINMDVCIDGTVEAGTMRTRFALVGTTALPNLPGATMFLDTVQEAEEVRSEAAKN